MERVIEDDNLLEEILLCLPAEIVHGFLTVSKRWYNLISSPSFRRRHHNSNSSSSSSMIFMMNRRKGSVTRLLEVCNGVTIFQTSHIHPDKLLLSIQPFYEKLCQKIDESKEIEVGIRDVYNGLFLFSLTRKQNWGEVYYLVCNPLTKEYHELPRTRKLKFPRYTYSQVAFAPSSKPSNCYKVVLASVNTAPHGDYADYIVEVYSSETGIWEDLGHISHHSLYNSRYVVWDNCLLLVPECSSWGGWVRVVDSERLCVSKSTLLLSSLVDKKFSISYLGESGGVLYAIVIDTCNADRKHNHYKLWEMKEVNGSWKEKFQFKTKRDAEPLYVHRDGEHVWLSLIESDTVYYCMDGNTKVLEKAGYVGCFIQGWNIRFIPLIFWSSRNGNHEVFKTVKKYLGLLCLECLEDVIYKVLTKVERIC